MNGRKKPRTFEGDWPKAFDGGVLSPPTKGCGPQLADILCEACGNRPLATGECRCSE